MPDFPALWAAMLAARTAADEAPPVARSTTWDESDVRIRPNKKGSRPRTKDRPSLRRRRHRAHRHRRPRPLHRRRRRRHRDERDDSRRPGPRAAPQAASSPGTSSPWSGTSPATPDTLARLVRIEERTTLLRRSADDTDPVERVVVANADQLVIVVAAANPEPRTGFIDRALVAAYDAGIEPLLCVTKADVEGPRDAAGELPAPDLGRQPHAAVDAPASTPVRRRALRPLDGACELRAARRQGQRAGRAQRRRQVHAGQRAGARRRPRRSATSTP